jgi:Mg2+ and Co2+ transporter CorA
MLSSYQDVCCDNAMLRAEYIVILCILVVGGSSMVTDHDQPNSLHVAHSNGRTMTDEPFKDILSILVEKVNKLETVVSHAVSSTKTKTEDLYSKLYYMSKQFDTLQTKHDSMELELHMAKQEIMSIKMLLNSSSKIGDPICEKRINKLEEQLAMTKSNVQNFITEQTVSTRDLRAIYNKTMEAEQGITNIKTNLTKAFGEIAAKNKHGE